MLRLTNCLQRLMNALPFSHKVVPGKVDPTLALQDFKLLQQHAKTELRWPADRNGHRFDGDVNPFFWKRPCVVLGIEFHLELGDWHGLCSPDKNAWLLIG